MHIITGISKSGCQKFASLASNGRHIISVGDIVLSVSSAKQKKSVKSCAYFFYGDVSVAGTKQWCNSAFSQCSSQTQDHRNTTFSIRDSKLCFQSNCFSFGGPCRGSATWPEEQLLPFDLLVHEDQNRFPQCGQNKVYGNRATLETWGLVIAAAGLDGMIRTFHNYGFPTRL